MSALSVVIPCFQCADTIDRAIRSVALQTRTPSEVVLVDDCSADNRTRQALLDAQRYYSSAFRIEVVSLPTNVGAGAARNVGWERATQQLVAFLDADDAWHPSKLELQAGWMNEHPGVALTGHRLVMGGEGLSPSILTPAVESKQLRLIDLLVANPISTSSVILRGDIPLRFPENRRYSEDYSLWLKVVASGLPVWMLDAPWGYVFKPIFGHSGLSSRLWEMEKGELQALADMMRDGYIGQLAFGGLAAFSISKHFRRLVLTWLRGALKR